MSAAGLRLVGAEYSQVRKVADVAMQKMFRDKSARMVWMVLLISVPCTAFMVFFPFYDLDL